ncbi:MAG: hypothetical protein KDB14_30590 [Planctomycetales bacterium]|nr:hypothetical protein [Planctomycetales bacterium]
MFETTLEMVGRARRCRIAQNGQPLCYGEVLELWRDNGDFRRHFVEQLAETPWDGFRWETPGMTKSRLEQPFEYVLLEASGFATRRSDNAAFAEHFVLGDEHHGVVCFTNLRGDATLVVPSPRAAEEAYGHLAAFVREAPAEQIDALWRVVGDAMLRIVAERPETPVWLSTAGGGVAWLHVRLDSRPKYYGHEPYRRLV